MSVCSFCGRAVEGDAAGRATIACTKCFPALARSSDALGRLCFNRGLELLGKGELRGAEEQLVAACTLMPAQVEPRRTLGKLRARLGSTEEAFIDLSWAKHLAPADAKTSAALAVVERKLAVRRRLGTAVIAAMFVATAAMMAFAGWWR